MSGGNRTVHFGADFMQAVGGPVAADLVMAAERRVTSSLVIPGGTVTNKKYVFSNARSREENIGKRASYFRERKFRSKGS